MMKFYFETKAMDIAKSTRAWKSWLFTGLAIGYNIIDSVDTGAHRKMAVIAKASIIRNIFIMRRYLNASDKHLPFAFIIIDIAVWFI